MTLTRSRNQESGTGRRRSTYFWVALAVAVSLAYVLLINHDTTGLPPSWDSATTVSPAALAIVDADFDVWAVAQEPGTLDWGPSTHATSIYTIALAAAIDLFGAGTAFALAHGSSLIFGGILAAATYLFARQRLEPAASAVASVSVSLLPLVLQQTAEIYLDLPLAIVTTLACWATVKRRFWLVALLVFVAVAIKTSGIYLVPLLLLARPKSEKLVTTSMWATVVGAAASIPFLLAFITTDRFDTTTSIASNLTLLGSAMSLLVLTTDVLLIMTAFLLVMYGRARNGTLDRPSIVASVVVVSFLGIHIATVVLTGTITILPRYYVDILPVVIPSILPVSLFAEPLRKPKNAMAVILLSVLALFSLANYRGDLYFFKDHSFYVAAERSTRAQDLLALQVEGTRALADTGLPAVIGHQEFFRVTYPEMGYVDQTPRELISLQHGWPTTLPARFSMLLEPRVNNAVNDFEEHLIEQGYEFEYQELSVGGFDSRLAIVNRPSD